MTLAGVKISRPVDIASYCSVQTLPSTIWKIKKRTQSLTTTAEMSTTGETNSKGTPDWIVPLWLNGQQITTTQTIEITSPLTDSPLYRSSAATASDALAAVSAAETAFPAWSKTKPGFRRDLFLRAAAELERRREDLWRVCSTETGSTEPYFDFDFGDALESLKSCAGLIASASGMGFVPSLLSEERSAMVVKEPYGMFC